MRSCVPWKVLFLSNIPLTILTCHSEDLLAREPVRRNCYPSGRVSSGYPPVTWGERSLSRATWASAFFPGCFLHSKITSSYVGSSQALLPKAKHTGISGPLLLHPHVGKLRLCYRSKSARKGLPSLRLMWGACCLLCCSLITPCAEKHLGTHLGQLPL